MTISYTVSPVHTLELFAKQAKDMADMGADSICIKDMAGLLSPVSVAALVKAIKKKVDLPVQIHSHYTSGMAAMTYMAALEAGADVVDCAISPFAMGTSQPATETMVAALAGGPLDTGLSLNYISELLRGRGPASLEICVLLDKAERRTQPVDVRYSGFVIPDEFVIGYGLDYAGRFRQLPAIHVAEPAD